MDLKKYIRSVKDYPKKGILFRDISTLIKNEKAFISTIKEIVKRSKKFVIIKLVHFVNLMNDESKNFCLKKKYI